jgi:periplasmic protein TonB
MATADETADIMQASLIEKVWSAVGAVIVVLLLGYLLLVGLTIDTRVRREKALQLLELQMLRPKPDRPPPHGARQKSTKASAKASPRNLRNKAAAIAIFPPPRLVPSPVVTAPIAGMGMAASAGASDRPGPAMGGQGRGNGTGAGGDGNGDDDGEVPPRLIKGRLKFSDLPTDLRDNDVGGTVSVHYGVETDGRVSDCIVMASSGSTELDRLTCRLIEQRFRFAPSRDHQGQPVRSIIEESHVWAIEHDRELHPQP